MGILEILILVAIAIIIFIVIRRLPETRGHIEDKLSSQHKSIESSSSSRDLIHNFLSSLERFFDKYSHIGKKVNKQAPETQEELKKQLKKPEDREFWIDEVSHEKKALNPDLIAKTYFEDAEEAFQNKDYRKAEALFLEIAKENPHNIRAFNRLGIIYLEQKNFDDAVEAFLTTIKFDNKVSTRYYNLALAYVGKGDYKEAVKNLKEAIKLSPSNEKYKEVLEQIKKKC